MSAITTARLGFADTKGRGDLDQLAHFALENDFSLIQISLDNAHYFPENVSRESRFEAAGRLKDKGLGLCFHGPSDLPLLNRHKSIRLAAVERLFEMVDLSIQMGGEYFIIHPGRLAFYSSSTQQVFFMEHRFPAKFKEIFTDSFNRLLDYAAGRIIICIENSHLIDSSILKGIEDMMEDGRLSLVWDAGHIESLPATQRAQLLKFFQDNMRSVKLGHLHDIRDGRDHKELGTGKLDVASYLEIFNALEIDVILEIFPEKELLRSMEYLKKLKATTSSK